MSRRLSGASGATKSGMVRSSRLGLVRNATGHSVMRSSLTGRYCPGAGSSMQLALQDKGNRLFRAFCCCGESGGLFMAGERIVVVASIGLIRRAALRMAPHAIFEDLVPNVAAARPGGSRIGADEVRIQYGGV